MNPAQTMLYFREWRACADALKALGRPYDNEVRHALQADAIGGFTKSSKKLTNGELTKVLARFRSYSQPGNLAAQLKPEDEPTQTRADYFARIDAALFAILPDAKCRCQHGFEPNARRAYGNAIAKKSWHAANVEALDDTGLRKFTHALEARAGIKPGKATAAPVQTTRSTPAPEPAATEWDGEF